MTEKNGADIKSRGWCFTCNNYTDDDIVRVMDIDADYIIVGFEVGEQGTPHMQGYFYKKNTYRLNEAKRQLYPHFHIEPQKGTKLEAIVYCMKECKYWEQGKRPCQGKRSDLDLIHYEIKSGKKTTAEIAEEFFSKWVVYNRSFEKYERMVTRHKTRLIAYDDTEKELFYSFEKIYKNYGSISTDPTRPAMCLLYTNGYYHHSEMYSEYFSGRWRCIIVPCSSIKYETRVRELLDEVIERVDIDEGKGLFEFIDTESDGEI